MYSNIAYQQVLPYPDIIESTRGMQCYDSSAPKCTFPNGDNVSDHYSTSNFCSESVVLKNETSNAINTHFNDSANVNVKPIGPLLDELLKITANKSLPNLEEVQSCKARLKHNSKRNPLFSVLSELKEGGHRDLLRIVCGGTISDNIDNLRCVRNAQLNKIQDHTTSDDQLIRLDNMLLAEGVIIQGNFQKYPSGNTDRKGKLQISPSNRLVKNENSDDYDEKLSKIREVYTREESYINDELNIFPKHVSHVLYQHSEIRPITQIEINILQKIVNRRYSILHQHLKQKTCEAVMMLRARCLDARRKRKNFGKKSSEILNEFFFSNVSHPYPSEEDKQALAKKCGITVSQVCNWFGNKRIRYKKSLSKNQPNPKCQRNDNSKNDFTNAIYGNINWLEPTYSGANSCLRYNL